MAEPEDRLYSTTHEWVKIEGTTATVGITRFAQEQLGDVVFVELAEAGKTVGSGDSIGNIESVKAVSEIFSPVAGTVTSLNAELENRPELVNEDPYGEGWLIRLEVAAGAGEGLMDTAAYEAFLAEEGVH